VKVTASTITDQQVRDIKAEAARSGDEDLYALCGLAGHPGHGRPREPLVTDLAYKARGRLAQIINTIAELYASRGAS
jgi:hypothetical protein